MDISLANVTGQILATLRTPIKLVTKVPEKLEISVRLTGCLRVLIFVSAMADRSASRQYSYDLYVSDSENLGPIGPEKSEEKMLEDRYGKRSETFVWSAPIFFSALSSMIFGLFNGPFSQGVSILYAVFLLIPAIFLTAISIRLLRGSIDLGKRLIYVVAIWIVSPILGSVILLIFSLPSFKVFWPALIYTSLYAAVGLIVGVTAQFKALATKCSISQH